MPIVLGVAAVGLGLYAVSQGGKAAEAPKEAPQKAPEAPAAPKEEPVKEVKKVEKNIICGDIDVGVLSQKLLAHFANSTTKFASYDRDSFRDLITSVSPGLTTRSNEIFTYMDKNSSGEIDL